MPSQSIAIEEMLAGIERHMDTLIDGSVVGCIFTLVDVQERKGNEKEKTNHN